MSRPDVSVVIPFAGDGDEACAVAEMLRALETQPGDELILVDNQGTAGPSDGLTVIRASGERSPAHARNVGANGARNDWILFLDADTRASTGLLDAYFEPAIGAQVGAVAGEVLAAAGGDTLAARYGAARSFLGQRAHLEHPYRPRASAANLLVRRAAFVQIGGFYEGIRAAEDTDFSWRLQRAGWGLELRPDAWVEHRYRTSVSGLRRQWRGYAAGRAWLARRYEGYEPEPAVRRAARRGAARVSGVVTLHRRGDVAAADPAAPRSSTSRGAPPVPAGRLERGRYLALDALLSIEELAGLTLSNRPARGEMERPPTAEVVLVADRFPEQGDPLVELARTLERARVEAAARPEVPDADALHRLEIDYLEDDGTAARAFATVVLALRHPLRCALDLIGRGPREPRLASLAPAVRRVRRGGSTRVLALGGDQAQATTRRIGRLSGRPSGELPPQPRRVGAHAPRGRRR